MAREVYQIKTISQYHQLLSLPMPEHPHFSIIELTGVKPPEMQGRISLTYDFYVIFMKQDLEGKFKYHYGQQTLDLSEADFQTSKLFFMSPGQLLGIEPKNPEARAVTGWMMLIHPDYLWKTPLAKTITQYEFFHYSVSESLNLTPQEEARMFGIINNIRDEYQSKVDKYSQNVIIAELELLLTYSERFYNRQFITRKMSNHHILEKLEDLLNDYFNDPQLLSKGLPTVQYISDQLNLSPNYLRSLLKSFTGLNTQEHIHKKLIEQAKQKLSATELSVSQIAYQLGFEHAPSFSKLFKNKTLLSPQDFRKTFN